MNDFDKTMEEAKKLLKKCAEFEGYPNTLHEYNMDSEEFSTELDHPKIMTQPAVIFKEGDLLLFREYIRYTIDYTENPPKETFEFSGRIIIERIDSTKNDCTTITKVFEGVAQ